MYIAMLVWHTLVRVGEEKKATFKLEMQTVCSFEHSPINMVIIIISSFVSLLIRDILDTINSYTDKIASFCIEIGRRADDQNKDAIIISSPQNYLVK